MGLRCSKIPQDGNVLLSVKGKCQELPPEYEAQESAIMNRPDPTKTCANKTFECTEPVVEGYSYCVKHICMFPDEKCQFITNLQTQYCRIHSCQYATLGGENRCYRYTTQRPYCQYHRCTHPGCRDQSGLRYLCDEHDRQRKEQETD